MKKLLVTAWSFLTGKKTYIAAAAAVVYGLIQGDRELLLIGLGLLGLRHGVSTEINDLLTTLKRKK